jgi:NTE family protein
MSTHASYQDQLLAQNLHAILGDLDDSAMNLLRQRLEWVELAAGETLMTQGDPGDSMYLSISGRLRAYVKGDGGAERMVREMARGQVIGEMSLLTDEPRSATVLAIRDSVLVRLSKADFVELFASGSQASLAFTRRIIKRLQTTHAHQEHERPVTIALMPVTAGVDAMQIAASLAEHLGRRGPCASSTRRRWSVNCSSRASRAASRATRPSTGASRSHSTASRRRTTTCCSSPTTLPRRGPSAAAAAATAC